MYSFSFKLKKILIFLSDILFFGSGDPDTSRLYGRCLDANLMLPGVLGRHDQSNLKNLGFCRFVEYDFVVEIPVITII